MGRMISVRHKGNFLHTERFMNRALKADYLKILDSYGRMGVQALENNTPEDTGKTAHSWNYGIESENGKTTLYWTNSNEQDGVNIAVLLIYGHGLQNGSYVQGINFVDPALEPIFRQIAENSWREVVR